MWEAWEVEMLLSVLAEENNPPKQDPTQPDVLWIR